MIFITRSPHGDVAVPCGRVLGEVGPTRSDLATAVANAPGVDVVSAPTEVTVDGRVGTYVAVTANASAGCHPGFFFRWPAESGGALWPRGVDVTVRAWMVGGGDRRIVIGALTTEEADPELEDEIQEIVGAIHFQSGSGA